MWIALVGAFNQEKALVGAFSVIVKTDCETDGSSAALVNIESTLQCKIDRAAAAVSGDHKIQSLISNLSSQQLVSAPASHCQYNG